MSPGVADPDQDFEQEALRLFQLGDHSSDAGSVNETDSGLNSFSNSPQSFDFAPLPPAPDNLPLPHANPGPSGDDFFSSFFNMDLDDTPDTSLPPPPPSNFSLRDLDLSLARSGASNQDMSSVAPPPLFTSHATHDAHASRGRTRSPVPFSFRGGAPCIVPSPGPPTTRQVISLNSDNELDNPPFGYQHYWHHKALDSDSSHLSKPLTQTSSSHLSDGAEPPRAPVSTPPTSAHDNSSSVASGSRRSAAKGKGKQRAQVAPAMSANEKLVMKADDLISKGKEITESIHADKARRRDARYQDKAAERSHQQWLAQHEQSMARLKLEQLELEKLRRSAN